MYHTKKDVDAHVKSVLKKLQSERERQLRGLTIAKMYFRVNEFNLAEQYVMSYLNANEENDQAHKLLGQCYLRLKRNDQALKHFQRSLHINAKQPDVIIEVCKLLNDDQHFHPNKAGFWCELAESEKVVDESVFNLRLKLMQNDSIASDQFEEMLHSQVAANPSNITARVRLLQYYIDKKKILEAFKYILSYETKQQFEFLHEGDWYNAVWLVLIKYESLPNIKKDWDFWFLVVLCLDRQIQSSFSATGPPNTSNGKELANLLFNFDQYLYQMSQVLGKFSVQKELAQYCLNHYRGQFLLHSAALIFNREIAQNKNRWKDTTIMALPLLLLAFQMVNPNKKEPWMMHSDEQGKFLVQLWKREAAFRCCQTGRTILSCIDETPVKDQLNNFTGSRYLWSNGNDLLNQIRTSCSDKTWRKKIFALLFCNSDQKLKEQTSLLIKCSKFAEPIYELPSYVDIESFEDLAHYLKPQSLSHLVYICLGNENLSTIRAKFFSGLSFSVGNLSSCRADSLNQLDMDSFMYAATIQAKRSLEVERENQENYYTMDGEIRNKPLMLLFENLRHHLCTDEQANWWLSAYKTYKNIPCENSMETRQNIQYGIEAVRGLNGPKVDMIILFKFGKIFVDRAQDLIKPVEKAQLEARAESIFKCGLNMVKLNNKGILEPFRKLFKYAKANSSAIERQVASCAEEAISFLAARYFKKGEYEELVDELNDVQLPFAAYLQAEAYRKLDEISKTPKAAKRMYMERASQCLSQTLEYLKNPQIDPNHPLNSIIQSELKKVQQSSFRHSTSEYFSPVNGNSTLHNNSSTYEDAEEELFHDNSMLKTPNITLNRSRRDSNIAAVLQTSLNKNIELEGIIKQIFSTLTLVKDEILDKLTPEITTINKDLNFLKDKVSEVEDLLKKSRISTTPPSENEVAQALDLYGIDEDLQNNLYAQTNNMFPNFGTNGSSGMGLINSPYGNQQQLPRLLPQQNTGPMNPSYNNSLFNQNYPMNYGSPFMMNNTGLPPSGLGQPSLGPGTLGVAPPPPQPSLLGVPRGPMNMPPFMEGGGGLNFMPPSFKNFGLNPPAPVPTLGTAPPSAGPLGSAFNSGGPLNMNLPLSPFLPPANNKPLNATDKGLPPVAPMFSSGVGSGSFNISLGTSNALTSNVPSTTLNSFNKALNNQPVEKGPPANVVITSSDPLPNPDAIAQQQTQQPTLSVTIPSHHIKSNLVSQANDLTTPLASSAAPIFTGFGGTSTSLTSSKITSGGYFSSPSTNLSFPSGDSVKDAIESVVNNSNTSADLNQSGKSLGEVEYDPRPDFQPIIPLPAEVEVRTGEEDEEIVFVHRAKLFRYIDNQWKERGLGDIKILKDKQGLSRIVMRREQTHKICANHKIVKELLITAPKKDDQKGFIWTAQDYADEEMKSEKFFIRFKTPETAKEFFDCFKKAQQEHEEWEKKNDKKKDVKKENSSKTSSGNTFTLATSTPASKANETPKSAAEKKTSVSSTAAVTSTTLATPKEQTKTSTTMASPFANFSFGSSIGTSAPTLGQTSALFSNIFNSSPAVSGANSSTVASPFGAKDLPNLFSTANAAAAAAPQNESTAEEVVEDYVPTAEFNPVIPLPDLVEVTTGEENENILFEHRAKLLRFDKDAGEWKERGLGNIKILQDKKDFNKVRLVMRREQIHKLCCNSRLYKNTQFKYAKNSETALTWAAPDYSENELVTQMLTIRFKTPDICKRFHEAIRQAQEQMDDDSAEEGGADKKDTKVAAADSTTTSQKPQGFGDKFKPKAGSWNCEACYTLNEAEKLYCVACDGPKDDTVPKKEATNAFAPSGKTTFSFGLPPAAAGAGATSSVASSTTTPSFSFGSNQNKTPSGQSIFGLPPANNATTAAQKDTPAAKGFGDLFKPKAGSWDCSACYLSNPGDVVYCKACEEPKDSTVPKKTEEKKNDLLALSNPSQKFSFGFGGAAKDTTTAADATFTFGLPAASKSEPLEGSKPFSFAPPQASSTTLGSALSTPSNSLQKEKFTFTLHSKAMDKPAQVDNSFNFSFTPKSPVKSASQGQEEDNDEGDDHYLEEEEPNVDFAPVIPLPDKIDVKTGEENEELLYCHRAKLFRYDVREWKERGIGNLKILRHKDNNKLRVIMRRDQVHKLCLNHVLNEEVQYRQQDDKSWVFAVNDYSEGTVEYHKMALRFKNKEIADDFMKHVEQALDGSAVAIEDTTSDSKAKSPVKSSSTSSQKDDVSAEENSKKNVVVKTESCEGCDGCKANNGLTNPKLLESDENSLPLDMPFIAVPKSTKPKPDKQQSTKSSSSSSDSNSNSSTSTNSSVKAAQKPASQSEKSGGVATSVTTPSSAVNFSFSSALNSTYNTNKSAEEGGPIMSGNFENKFGTTNFFGATVGKSLFGGVSQAGDTSTTATQSPVKGSIFGGPLAAATTSASQSPAGLIFGGSLTTPSTASQSPASITGGSIFGGSVGSAASKTASQTSSTANSIFGTPSSFPASGLFQTSGTTPSSIGSIFGTPAGSLSAGSPFGSSGAKDLTSKFIEKEATKTSSSSSSSDQDKSEDSTKSSTESTSTAIFMGATKPSPLKDSIFGSSLASKNIFGTNASATTTTTPTTKVSENQTESKSIFGTPTTTGANEKDKTEGGGSTNVSMFSGQPLFGSSAPIFDMGSSVFGTTAPVFGDKNQSSSGSIFGNNTFGGKPSFGGTSLFGSFSDPKAASSTASPSTTTTTPATGASSGSIFGSGGSLTSKTVTFADLNPSNSAIDFASLASKAPSAPKDLSSFKLKGKPTGETNFIGLTEQQDAFSVKKDTSATNISASNKSGSGENENDETGGDGNEDDNYDPHYDPIVALPDKVVVSTGEEEEDKLFGERATLYRFDATNKEWKERGVGEIKILAHPAHGTFRMVMRREQIFKLVLNHAIGADFSFNNMGNNPNAFIWAAHNFAETKEGEFEKLALRFKKGDKASEFKKILTKCIADASSKQ